MRNKTAVAGLVIIIFCFLISLLGYIITPDKTANANRMMLSIANKKPMFSCKVMEVPTTNSNQSKNKIHELLFGKSITDELIAIKDFEVDQVNGMVVVTEYTDADDTTRISRAFPLSIWNSANKQVQARHYTFVFGTDRFGRDMLSRLILGARVSMAVGLIAVIISLVIGLLLGSIAGYFGGRVDAVISWFINVVWSIPTLLIVIALSLAIGKGFWQVFVAVGLTMWVDVARMVRGQVLSVREKEFVEACRAMGFSNTRIILRHILPNISAPLIVITCANFASAILLEAGLSFLGFGVQPPVPSWGMMIKEHYGYIVLNKPHLALIPGFAIALLVIAFNMVGSGLRDAWDVKE